MSYNTMIFLRIPLLPAPLPHMYRVATYYSNSPPVNYIQCEFHLHLKIYHFQIDISIFNISPVFHFHSTFQPSSKFSIPEQYCCLKADMYIYCICLMIFVLKTEYITSHFYIEKICCHCNKCTIIVQLGCFSSKPQD